MKDWEKQIQRIMVLAHATNMALNSVKGQGKYKDLP